jgi:hypothetical protein
MLWNEPLARSNSIACDQQAVNAYFARWIAALADALKRAGRDSAAAQDQAEEIVLEIPGAIVLARAMSDPAIFQRALKRMRARVAG